MNISIVGTGYVGLVTATCFAELGVNVTCVDTDSQKINRLVYGAIPIYEPGLENMVTTNVNDRRLHFASDFSKGFEDVDFVFCAVDTAPDEDGSTNLKPIYDIAKIFGQRGRILFVNIQQLRNLIIAALDDARISKEPSPLCMESLLTKRPYS